MTYPIAVPPIEIPAAALTIARRLDRAGLADTDNAATAAWLHDLALYESLIDSERRMALYIGAARVVDRETGEVTHDADRAADAALRDAMGDLEAWRAHAGECRAMVAWLDAALTTIAAIPVVDLGAYQRACGLWCRLRHGDGKRPAVRPLPPSAPWRDWSWPVALAWHQTDGYIRYLPLCRQRWRLLAAPGRRAVLEEFGIASDLDLLHKVYPVAERDALDERANTLGVSLFWSLMGPGVRRSGGGVSGLARL